MNLRSAALTVVLGAFSLCWASAAPATAAPMWNLEMHHNPTNFPSEGTGEYWFDIDNVGNTGTVGPITLTVNLPAGMTREFVDIGAGSELTWSCPGAPGDKAIVCTSFDSLPRHTVERRIFLSVNVSGASSLKFATAKLEGGGASKAVTDLEPTPILSTPAGFGVLPESFTPDFFEADTHTPVRESGAHPEIFTVPFDVNTLDAPAKGDPRRKKAVENVRNLQVDLPPGFLGNPTAVAECTQAQFTLNDCPLASQVGRLDVSIYSASQSHINSQARGLFNLTHPRGAVADLAISVVGVPVHIKASLDPANNYAVKTEVSNINEILPLYHQKLTTWGIPADSSHDSERCNEFSKGENDPDGGDTSKECSTQTERTPFLTFPSQCGVDHEFRLHSYDSWENAGVFGPDIEYTLPGETTDCDIPRFDPSVSLEPTGKQANTPTGLDVRVKVPQNDNPNALATPPVKSTTVTLPEGMTFSPSFADGLEACTPAQIGLFTNDPIKCPDASRVGEVELATPLLPKAVVGSMYLAAQGDNPFQSTFAIYLEVHDTEERGVLIKIPGRIDVDQQTGQITTVFDDLPQFPFEGFTLKFRSGPRAPLVNPPTCGSHTIGVEVTSYAQPTEVLDRSSTYEVTEGPGGAPCPGTPASRPFAPQMNAGTVNPNAGSYSPFVFRMTREDAEQELSQVKSTLPQGLVGKIAGIPFCPEAALASISTAEGTGKAEAANPVCPAASQIGSLNVGAGSGPGPNYFPGRVYLAGPYKGAQISLAVVVPAIAGPLDLGSVLVRVAAHIDPETTLVTAISDPFPTILHGVLLRVRDVRLKLDRDQTMINPTSCDPMAVTGQMTGVGGDLFSTLDDSIFNTQNPFQVANCANLRFAPKLGFRLFGGTKRGAHPKLRAVVRMPEGGANIKSASVALPRSEFLDQSHIGTVCTRVQFKANACPAGSIYGKAEARSPLLDETLSGPIYLRSSENLLPDLVAAFRGGRIDFNLIGRIDSVNQGIRNTFDFVPDVPVSWARFTFQGGRKGLLINSRNLCRKTYRAVAKFRAHSGKTLTTRPALQNSCKKARKGKRKQGKRR